MFSVLLDTDPMSTACRVYANVGDSHMGNGATSVKLSKEIPTAWPGLQATQFDIFSDPSAGHAIMTFFNMESKSRDVMIVLHCK